MGNMIRLEVQHNKAQASSVKEAQALSDKHEGNASEPVHPKPEVQAYA